MTRLVLLIAAGFAVLSALYLGAVSLFFSPPDVAAPSAVVEARASESMFDEAPYAAPQLPSVPPPSATFEVRPPVTVQPADAMPDSSATTADTAAVRRLTVALARQTRGAAHVGKPVAPHIATDALGLGDDGCKTTDGVQLCLSADPVGGWKIVGTSQGYAVAARGPATLGESLRVTVE